MIASWTYRKKSPFWLVKRLTKDSKLMDIYNPSPHLASIDPPMKTFCFWLVHAHSFVFLPMFLLISKWNTVYKRKKPHACKHHKHTSLVGGEVLTSLQKTNGLELCCWNVVHAVYSRRFPWEKGDATIRWMDSSKKVTATCIGMHVWSKASHSSSIIWVLKNICLVLKKVV
jgi:hypothetical protein